MKSCFLERISKRDRAGADRRREAVSSAERLLQADGTSSWMPGEGQRRAFRSCALAIGIAGALVASGCSKDATIKPDESATKDAEKAKREAKAAKAEAEVAKAKAEAAHAKAEQAKAEASHAKAEADKTKAEADKATAEATEESDDEEEAHDEVDEASEEEEPEAEAEAEAPTEESDEEDEESKFTLAKPPSVQDWLAASEVTVTGSSGLGCETKMAGPWIRISCRGSGIAGVSMLRGEVPGRTFTFERDGLASLVMPFVEGTDADAQFVYARGPMLLQLRWPRGAPKPPVKGEFSFMGGH